MGTAFDELLADLHNTEQQQQKSGEYVGDLKINEKRQFVPINDFDTTIAFEGDVNSKEITIDILSQIKNHNLSQCEYKELRWKNLTNGAEGISKLLLAGSTEGEYTRYIWEVPSDVCMIAGNIEISISFYDREGNGNDGNIAFAWHTASYRDLVVAKTMSSVGTDMPALDDILTIDEETRNIIAPSGYVNTICNYGDRGIVDVYFIVNRYLGRKHNIDVFSQECKKNICIKMNGLTGIETGDNIEVSLYSSELTDRKNEGMVLITWHVPAGITAGNGGPNNLEISVGFEQDNNRWYSNSYNKLNVGHSFFEYNGEEDVEEWGLTEDLIKSVIDKYFEEGMVVFDPNE